MAARPVRGALATGCVQQSSCQEAGFEKYSSNRSWSGLAADFAALHCRWAG
jgi:hypothetical protein